jgi:hypothetical protein
MIRLERPIVAIGTDGDTRLVEPDCFFVFERAKDLADPAARAFLRMYL